MRYYDITITPPKSAQPVKRWTSHPNGISAPPDPGALQVEFDMFVYPQATPMGGSSVTVEGVRLDDLQQSAYFAGMYLTVKGGMGAGLPLANPAQAGLLFAGQIYQSFGNWIGTDMQIDLVPTADTYSNDLPGNIVFSASAGLPLSGPITSCLSVAYPGIPVNISISPNIAFNHTESSAYATLSQFSRYLNSVTAGMLGSDYPGIDIVFQGNQFFVFDGTQAASKVNVAFTDLIGQPSWITVNTLQFRTVMRADIAVGSIVNLPPGMQSQPGIVQTAQSAVPAGLKYQTSFQGEFLIRAVRHVGSYRQPDGNAWVSIFNATPANAGAA